MCCVEKNSQSDSQQVEVVDVASHVEWVLHCPDDFICHHVVGEEDHQVIGEANGVDADSKKERHCETCNLALTTGPYLKGGEKEGGEEEGGEEERRKKNL